MYPDRGVYSNGVIPALPCILGDAKRPGDRNLENNKDRET